MRPRKAAVTVRVAAVPRERGRRGKLSNNQGIKHCCTRSYPVNAWNSPTLPPLRAVHFTPTGWSSVRPGRIFLSHIADPRPELQNHVSVSGASTARVPGLG